ncbi:putative thioredoxin [Fusarium austroafricanum]|uniref:Putative thioredoxin n=1 Tax=Fusarium austroafricanum TaxID=2364996 RepID=A0A8H4P5C6_9HYPO|nr:putative thioredoxin [Fusarium austroafricanum]
METIYIVFGLLALFMIAQSVFADRSPIPETSGKVFKIAESSELDAVLASHTRVVVDFYADWCPPCRAIAPVFSGLADTHAASGKLAFAKVNTDHVKDVAQKYGITAMPTFVFFEGGEAKDRIRGANRGKLESSVKALAAQE